ncbi:MAG: ABC transporter ATP-binding protein [Myxococcota bacterium]|nr:ABC transporter ATP-binding protein [Myxococcota bacterium]
MPTPTSVGVGRSSRPARATFRLAMDHPAAAPPNEAPREVAVWVRELVKDYGSHRAVDHLSFEVPTGEFFGFLGPNGAGKSTTIRILCGLMRPSSGEAEVAGSDVLRDPVGVKARIGVLPEEPVLYERLSGREMLWYSGRLYGLDGATVERRSGDLLDLMGLTDTDADKAIVDYSMGMRKKIGLACALLHRPRVLFLDEPFNGIDAVTSRSIYRVLKGAVAGGMTVFFSSHVLEVAESLCTSVGIIDQGTLRALGSLTEVREQVGASPETPLGDLFVDMVDPETRSRGEELLEWLA